MSSLPIKSKQFNDNLIIMQYHRSTYRHHQRSSRWDGRLPTYLSISNILFPSASLHYHSLSLPIHDLRLLTIIRLEIYLINVLHIAYHWKFISPCFTDYSTKKSSKSAYASEPSSSSNQSSMTRLRL